MIVASIFTQTGVFEKTYTSVTRALNELFKHNPVEYTEIRLYRVVDGSREFITKF